MKNHFVRERKLNFLLAKSFNTKVKMENEKISTFKFNLENYNIEKLTLKTENFKKIELSNNL